MRLTRNLRHSIRLLVLLSVLAGAYGLYRTNEAGDPRFYLFLTTPPGRLLARAFGWHRGLAPPPVMDKPDEKMTLEERAIKYRWERQIIAEAPLHQLVLAGGLSIQGRLISETPGQIVFQEAAGEGGLTASYARERVVRVDTLPLPSHLVTYRDIRLRLDLPGLEFYKRTPFTVGSDAPYAEVRQAVNALRALHADFLKVFQPLVERPLVRTDLQVVFLSRPGAFQANQRRYAPLVEEDTVGFYSVGQDRLFILNQSGDHFRQQARAQVGAEEETWRAAHPDADPERLARWRERQEQRLIEQAEEQTLMTIRHEGAHQLFFACGAHSGFRAENTWLTEGLASYCETPVLGGSHPDRVHLLADSLVARELIAWPDLTGTRSSAGLAEVGRGARIDLAYAQSWLLVHWLMEPERRALFFDYLKYLRDPANVRRVAVTPSLDLLADAIQVAPATLERALAAHIGKLAKP